MSQISKEKEALGRAGEMRLLAELTEARTNGEVLAFFRPEWFVKPPNGRMYLCEAKAQEHFEAPPFDGHGLPVRQAENYQLAYEQEGLRTLLVVYEGAARYAAWLDELHQGRFFDTHGMKPRRVFPLENFELRKAA